MRRINMLGCPMDVATMDETVAVIDEKIAMRVFTQHGVVNAAKLVNMRKDLLLSESVRSCEIINIDGMGVVFGARVLGHHIPGRVTGIDLFYQLLEKSAENGYPVFLLGATDEVVLEARKRMELLYPNLIVAGHHHGYFWQDEESIVRKIRESGARLLFVAITSPRKENFINQWKDQLGVEFVMGVGGTFDVVAGKVKRAPQWMQDSGLEWFYRVIQEPRRMWKRYLYTNTVFGCLLLNQCAKKLFSFKRKGSLSSRG
jgi:N-acetylglucosaminyldiphosphoundecaprenol N-acetyl-beta-D-mannosaminyltransferase